MIGITAELHCDNKDCTDYLISQQWPTSKECIDEVNQKAMDNNWTRFPDGQSYCQEHGHIDTTV